MVRLSTNEWTGNLSVILFVAFLLSELNGKALTLSGRSGGMLPRENLKFRSSKTAGNGPKSRILLIVSLSMGMHPYSGIKNRIARGARG